MSFPSTQFLKGAIALTLGQFGEENHPIAIDYINCNGSEERVINCDRSRDERRSCGRFEDAGIVCQGMYLIQLVTVRQGMKVFS